MGGGNNNNSSNNTNWAEIEREARRVEREICMEGLHHDMEHSGIEKGQLDALEQEKKTRRTEVFIFHALIVKMINVFKQSVIFLWYLMQTSL